MVFPGSLLQFLEIQLSTRLYFRPRGIQLHYDNSSTSGNRGLLKSLPLQGSSRRYRFLVELLPNTTAGKTCLTTHAYVYLSLLDTPTLKDLGQPSQPAAVLVRSWFVAGRKGREGREEREGTGGREGKRGQKRKRGQRGKIQQTQNTATASLFRLSIDFLLKGGPVRQNVRLGNRVTRL